MLPTVTSTIDKRMIGRVKYVHRFLEREFKKDPMYLDDMLFLPGGNEISPAQFVCHFGLGDMFLVNELEAATWEDFQSVLGAYSVML